MALRPILAICGTTGVGKSKLAIELALTISNTFQSNPDSTGHSWRGARIINADAMQVYSGMDILTNKVPPEEQAGVDHLLMGFKKPGEQYVVGQWVRDAMEAVSRIPIVLEFSLMPFVDRRDSSTKPNTYSSWRDIVLDATSCVSWAIGFLIRRSRTRKA